MKIAVCDDDEGCLDSMKQLLASYPGISSEALILQHGGITEKIANSQIWYIESNAHQLLIHTISGEISLYEKLDVYEKKLHKNFLRVHKSFLVNMQYIRRTEMKEVTLQDQIPCFQR